jgi:hypothetical protein
MLTKVKKEEDGNSDGEIIPKDEDEDPNDQEIKGQKMKKVCNFYLLQIN